MTAAVLLWALWPGLQAPSSSDCGKDATTGLEAAAVAVLAGEFSAAEADLRGRYGATGQCRELVVAAWSWVGWQTAAAAVAQGGTVASLGGANAAVAELAKTGRAASPSSYAAAVLHAAIAAAQDERDEMQVWLEHARQLATTIALTGGRARWPLPFDLVDGELWSRVDDYELAEAGYMRALAERDSAAAWRGLGRARDRRGNRAGACAAYRRAFELSSAAYPKGVVASEARGYLLTCEP